MNDQNNGLCIRYKTLFYYPYLSTKYQEGDSVTIQWLPTEADLPRVIVNENEQWGISPGTFGQKMRGKLYEAARLNTDIRIIGMFRSFFKIVDDVQFSISLSTRRLVELEQTIRETKDQFPPYKRKELFGE